MSKKYYIHINVSEEARKRLRVLAAEEGVSIAYILDKILGEWDYLKSKAEK